MSSSPLVRVMYVDDEPHLRALAEVSLAKVGRFATLVCGSGQEALDHAPTFKPDMILLDVMMPEMDGIRTLQELRKLSDVAAVPIVFVTAKAQPSEIQRYHAVGAADVITKPFSPIELPGRLRAIWAALGEGADARASAS
jgi:two-component system OmpR family response regulator